MWQRHFKRKKKPVNFHVGHTVRISNGKKNFAKYFEQSFFTEILRINMVVRRFLQPSYEIEDLHKTPTRGQFYNKELTSVKITDKTMYRIDQMVNTRVNDDIRKRGSEEIK
jgi:hypothetical protein